MKFYLIKTPRIIQKLFSKNTWCFHSDQKEIYLTFDDGPHPEITPWVLKTLKEHDAKATFFCVGENQQKHTEVYQMLVSSAHTIGNHTYNHLNGWKTSAKAYLRNTKKAEQQNSTEKYFRPPYGKITPKQSKLLRKNGYKIILWDVLSADFDCDITPEKCLENVLKNAAKGSIVVFHDSKKAEKNLRYTLPKVLTHFKKEGYIFKVI